MLPSLGLVFIKVENSKRHFIKSASARISLIFGFNDAP